MYNNPMYNNNFYPYNNFFRNNMTLKRGFNLFNLKQINWSNILNNTQKTLNVINQAIPVYYQVKPIWGNAKTMLRMVSALKDNDDSSNNSNNKDIIKSNTNNQGPVFFI